MKKVDTTAAPKDAPTEIHCSKRHTGSSGKTKFEGTCPHRTSLARCFLFDITEKVKQKRLLKRNGQSCSCHLRPLLDALGERTKPRRIHENSTCTQHQQRNNPRLKTRRPKRVQGTTTLACQYGQRRRLRYRFSPGQFPLQFLDSFRFPSLPFEAASLHRCLERQSVFPTSRLHPKSFLETPSRTPARR